MVRRRRAAVAAALIAAAMCLGPVPQAQPAVFRVVLLGTGTPAPSLARLGPSTLVEAGVEKLIFDVGRGVYIRLNQVGIAFPDASAYRLYAPTVTSFCPIQKPLVILTGWAGFSSA